MNQCLDDGRYKYVKDFITDLKAIEAALHSIGAVNISDKLVRPLRWQASVLVLVPIRWMCGKLGSRY